VDYKLKTDATILLDMGHTLSRDHAWKGWGKGRKIENLNVADVLTVEE
jgi:hypothetical protein